MVDCQEALQGTSEFSVAEKIVNGAKLEAIKGVRYDARYARMCYPDYNHCHCRLRLFAHVDSLLHLLCHSERSEESRPQKQILRFAQNDSVFLLQFQSEAAGPKPAVYS